MTPQLKVRHKIVASVALCTSLSLTGCASASSGNVLSTAMTSNATRLTDVEKSANGPAPSASSTVGEASNELRFNTTPPPATIGATTSEITTLTTVDTIGNTISTGPGDPATTLATSVDASSAGPFSTYPRPVEGEIRVVSLGVDITPMTAVNTGISKEEAMQRLSSLDSAVLLTQGQGVRPDIELARYDNQRAPGPTQADGQPGQNIHSTTVAWVAKWTGLTDTGPLLGGNPASPVTSARTGWSCTAYVAIDADNGDVVGSFRLCAPKP